MIKNNNSINDAFVAFNSKADPVLKHSKTEEGKNFLQRMMKLLMQNLLIQKIMKR